MLKIRNTEYLMKNRKNIASDPARGVGEVDWNHKKGRKVRINELFLKGRKRRRGRGKKERNKQRNKYVKTEDCSFFFESKRRDRR